MSFKPVVESILRRFGTQVAFTSLGSKTYDPATGTVSTSGQTSKTLWADITQADDRKQNIEVQEGDLIAAVANVGFTPETDGTATLNGQSYRIVSVNNVYAFDELTMFEVQLRRTS